LQPRLRDDGFPARRLPPPPGPPVRAPLPRAMVVAHVLLQCTGRPCVPPREPGRAASGGRRPADVGRRGAPNAWSATGRHGQLLREVLRVARACSVADPATHSRRPGPALHEASNLSGVTMTT